MTESFLERIVAATREELAARMAETPLEEMRARAAAAPTPRDFAAMLSLRPYIVGDPLVRQGSSEVRLVERLASAPARLIAEIKRASPSKGLIAEHFDPVAQARAYEAGGAAAISVLTEPSFFKGSLDHLRAVRAAVHLPILRKDFLLDPYQVYEARAAGADAVLLLCSLLDDAQLLDLLALTHSLGMEALVEAHDAEEVRRAVAVGARVIGVNARDLRTFKVDPEVIRHLRPLVPPYHTFVAESGISDALGAARARAFGADAILVGEALMRAPDPTSLARELSTAPGGPLAGFFAGRRHPFIKICGLATPGQVRHAITSGADAFGLVFAPMAPAHRRVTVAQARELVAALDALPHDEMARRPAPLAVGVFVNEQPETIHQIAQEVGLSAIQLSGDESPSQCEAVRALTGLPILKSVRLRTADDLPLLDAYVTAGAVPLLDTPKAGSYGGTGETGDWALARAAAARWPVILSGGLTPENVEEAVVTVDPRGVDVSSGVETDQAKDSAKIARFIFGVRKGAHQLLRQRGGAYMAEREARNQ